MTISPVGKYTSSARQQLRRFNASTVLSLVSLALAYLTLGVAVWSVQKAGWVRPEPLLLVTLTLAMPFGILLAGLKSLKKWSIVVALVAGLGVIIWQSVIIFTANREFTAFQLWWQTVSNAAPNDAPIYFVMFLFFVTWVIGVTSAWFLWRRLNGWVTVFLGILMLFINVGNLEHDKYFYFPLFFLPATLLIVSCHLMKKSKRVVNWQAKPVRRGLWLYAISILLVMTVLTGAAYVIPEPPLDKIAVQVDTSNWGISDGWFNVFSTINSKWPVKRSRERETLLFKDAIETGDRVQFIINSSQSTYWTLRRYDVYQPTGWVSSAQIDRTEMSVESVMYPETIAATETLTYSVDNRVKTNIVLTRGDVTDVNIPTRLQVFTANNVYPAPPGILEIASVISLDLISPYQVYEAESRLITPTPEELKAAGDAYPSWIKGRYLQLPSTYPARVKDLAVEITVEAETAYDKAAAIKKYLNGFVYDQTVTPPPSNRDGVDYFLFSAHKGYCTHFASAMATMLRSVGVPTRLSTGYLRGEYDPSTGNYLLQGKNYHAWVEVYFPDIGWVDFESTPATLETTTEIPTEELIEDNYAFTEEDPLPPWMITMPENDININPVPVYNPARFPVVWLYIIGVFALIGIAIIIIRMVLNRWVARLQQADTAIEMYTLLCRLAGKANTFIYVYETPHEFAGRLARLLAWQEANIKQVVNSYLAMKYSREKTLSRLENQRLRKAWVSLCPSLIRYMLRLRKWIVLRFIWRPE